MNLRKPCQHGRYDEHDLFDGPRPLLGGVYIGDCPGGVFLPDDTLIASRAKIDWALVAVGDTDAKYQTLQTFLDALSVREAE